MKRLFVFAAVFALQAACSQADEPIDEPLINVTTTNNATTNNANNTNNREELPDFSPYFDLGRVMDIDIELDPDDWDTLRAQTRTFIDIIGGEDCLDQPVANVFTWFPTATVSVDGDVYEQVGIRKKGLLGSLSTEKPSLKLKFDKYVHDQRLDGIVERITLNNSRQDPSKMNTCLSYHLFRKAGVPAPRCNFAHVTVNGEDLGVFIHVESVKKPFLREHFDDEDGNLYEGTLSDFRDGWWRTFEKKTNEEENDFSDIEQAVAAFEMTGDGYREALEAIIDVEQFITFWALETLVAHWDGYAGNRNNFFIYREPEGRFNFIAWGADAAFRPYDGPRSIRAQGGLAHRFYNDPVMQPRYLERLRMLLDDVWDEDELGELIEQFDAIVQEHALPEERAGAADDIARIRDFVSDHKEVLLAEMEGPEVWPNPLPGNICWAEKGTFDATFETTWGTRDAQNPLDEGIVTIADMTIDGMMRAHIDTGAVAGLMDPEPNQPDPRAEIRIFGSNPGGTIDVWLIRVPPARFTDGQTIQLGSDSQAFLIQITPPMNTPTVIGQIPFGTLELQSAGLNADDPIVGRISGQVFSLGN